MCLTNDARTGLFIQDEMDVQLLMHNKKYKIVILI